MRKLQIILFLTLLIGLSVYGQQKEKRTMRYDSTIKDLKCDSIRGNFRLIRFSGKEVNNIKYDYILKSDSKHLRVVIHGEKVYTDSLGNVIIKDDFSDINDLSDQGIDVVIVEKNKKYGVFSADFKRQILPFEYDFIKYSSDNTFSLTQQINSTNKYSFGIANLDGAIILPPIYDNITKFNENGLATATKDSIISIINSDGKIIRSMSDKSAPLLSFLSDKQEGLNIVRMFSPELKFRGGRKYALMNNKGQFLLNPIYDGIYSGSKALNAIKKDDLKGLFNRKREFVVPIEYDEIRTMNNGNNALLMKKKNYNIGFKFFSDKEYQYIDSLGNVLISSSHAIKRVSDNEKDQLLVYMPNGYKIYDMDANLTDSLPNISLPARTWETFSDSDGGYRGFRDYWGEIKIPAQFKYIEDNIFYEPYVRVYEKNIFGKIQGGVIDTLGNIVIPIKYDKLEVIADKSDFRFILKKGKELYFINIKGKGVKHTMNYIEQVNYNPLTAIIFEKNGKYGIYDIYGKEMLPLEYDKCEMSYEKLNGYEYTYPKNIVVLYKNNKKGIWDADSRKITVPVIYDDFECFDQDLMIYRQNGKWGVLNCKTGSILTPAIYESIKKISDSRFFKVQQNSLWGLIDLTTGKNITPIEYELIERVAGSKVLKIRKNLLWGTISEEGKVEIPCRYDFIEYFNNDILIVGENVWCYEGGDKPKVIRSESTSTSTRTNSDSTKKTLRIVHREGVE